MRVCISFCKNCGDEYRFQASGNYWSLDTEEEYNDPVYCLECKKTITEVLSKISKKTEIRFIETYDFTLEKLFKKDEELSNAHLKQMEIDRGNNLITFPRIRRVFGSLFDVNKQEYSRTEEILVDGVRYRYSYWSKSKELIKITKEVRWDLEKDCIYKDK